LDPSDDEDLSDLSPEFLASIEGMHPGFRALFIETERDAMAALRARGGRPYDPALAAATTVEALTGARLTDLRLAIEVHRRASERREAAIRAARAVGYSWAELARIVGVTPQALHRRYRDR